MTSEAVANEPSATAPTASTIRILDPDGKRSRCLPLDWPLDVNGRVIDHVVVRRLSTRDVADFVAQIREDGVENRLVRWPMFYDLDGNRLAAEVMDALDDDDADTITKAASDFLPRRFKVDE